MLLRFTSKFSAGQDSQGWQRLVRNLALLSVFLLGHADETAMMPRAVGSMEGCTVSPLSFQKSPIHAVCASLAFLGEGRCTRAQGNSKTRHLECECIGL